MSQSMGLVRPDVSPLVKRVMSGEVFTGVLLDDTEQRAATLKIVLDSVLDEGTRVVWVGNPLRSPLTIERFLIQIVGPEIDLRVDRSPADLARAMAQPLGSESRLLIVVQQPETINAETRDLLASIAGHLGGEGVQVQFLFSGSSAFVLPRPAEPKALFPALLPAAASSDTESVAARGTRWEAWPLVVLLLAMTAGAVVTMAPSLSAGLVRATVDFMAPAKAVPAASPPPVLAASPMTDIAVLRQEFDAFLAQRASSLPPMSPSQKDALFTEFLTRHHRE